MISPAAVQCQAGLPVLKPAGVTGFPGGIALMRQACSDLQPKIWSTLSDRTRAASGLYAWKTATGPRSGKVAAQSRTVRGRVREFLRVRSSSRAKVFLCRVSDNHLATLVRRGRAANCLIRRGLGRASSIQAVRERDRSVRRYAKRTIVLITVCRRECLIAAGPAEKGRRLKTGS